MQNEVWRLSSEARLVHPDDTDVYFIYGQQSGIQFELNESAFNILHIISKNPSSIQSIIEILNNDYNIDQNIANSDIRDLFLSLKEGDLIQFSIY